MASGSHQNGKDAIEKVYQKKTPLEHILLRPDTYIGSVEMVKEQMWVYDKENKKMIQKEISYVPGLYKIFDEILVNAADNKQRDKNMTRIKIDINQEENTISIYNNGKGIPVVMHKDEKMYVPTMIFGHLLTSSNYNDEEEKVTGGRNGYGAKLCNIFSTKFKVETACREYKAKFKQQWGENMKRTSDPRVESFSGEDFTKVTFSPDLSKFKMEKLDDDIVSLMNRRAFDVAASTRGVAVFLNGEKIPVKNFKDYVDLYLKDNLDESGGAPPKVVYENVNERWEVALTMSDRGFQQMSFVNSIATTKGGRHVDHVTDAIVKQLIEVLKKKNKGGTNIKPFQVKNHLWIFINCLIVNPTFDSQTKENMTLQSKSFGSKCGLSEKFITNVTKCGVVESVLQWAKFKAQTELGKTSGSKKSKIKGIPKLEDANDAGTKNSHLCTLILTEGDSAKTLAVSGLGVVGRDHFGVFPLRGKLLNVREATHKQILENAEINNLIKILGLQYKKKYNSLDDLKSLRYGKVMIMTDQDQDGSHIKGLVINFIHTNWPELLRLPFLEEFITPIVKATKKNEVFSFYSLPEFEEWKSNTHNAHTYSIKYYKGLGTSTSNEAKEYFKNMRRHKISFKYDGSVDDDAIVMAFSKKCVDQRKEWLTAHMAETKRRKQLGLQERYLYTKDTTSVSYAEFVNLELVLFSNADNERSIPSLVDGFKPGQRKVIFTCFKRNDKKEVKVAQLAGSVAEKSAYHHGEQSLCSTIVNLAQNFVGSNNINLLQPKGQFGTRLAGGKDSASPRYIFTMLSPLARLIFHPNDDPLLQYQKEDNQDIEPVWYLPIIPMVLVNGAEGIGTGWSTKIPNYNPRELISNLRLMIQSEEPQPMKPYYKNFTGDLEYMAEHRYVSTGNVAILPGNRIEITELPIGVWTQTYKENVLEPLLHGSEKVKAIINDYKEYHTDATVRFVISFAAGEFDRIRSEDGGFHRVFKLQSSINTNQMHAFDDNLCLRRFDNVSMILKEFFTLRLEYYVKRKEYLVGMLTAEADFLGNQARFIVEKCDGTIRVENKKRKVVIEELLKRGYKPDPVREWKRKINPKFAEQEASEDAENEGGEEEEETAVVDVKKGKKPVDPEKAFNSLQDVKQFDYLVGMKMWMLTEEKKRELLNKKDTKLNELNILKQKTPEDLWKADLDNLEAKLDEVEKKERDEMASSMVTPLKGKGKKETGARGLRLIKGEKSEIYPAVNGDKVEFRITAELVKKFEKAVAASQGVKKEKAPKKEKKVKEETEEMDDLDALVNAGNSSIDLVDGKKPAKKTKKASDGMKQPKLNFPKATKKSPKKATGEFVSDEDEMEVISPPSREKAPTRAASKKIVYNFDDDEEEDDGAASEGFGDSDSDMEMKPANQNMSSEDMFDSLKEDKDSSPPQPQPKAAPTQRKLLNKPAAAAPSKVTKRAKMDDSDDDVQVKKSRKKAGSSDEDFSPVKKPARGRKKATYAESDDSDSDY
ncbi:DNA topoisomerase 2 isoform X2 [Phlebotomus argentipes]|uniref:DNA topoisomerase 2 isoform X2 n=1 Tax=Phlebotomus argentipes TaxID=94469 RepID=UPI00289322BB|nr:DNA topoisomerase 2 isoform X2 [Phlebotomus argentipes]